MRSGSGSSWLAGLVLGALGGFLLLEGLIFGMALLVAAVALIFRTGRRVPGIGGLLIGVGIIWLGLLGRVKLSCTQETGCSAPTIDGYLVVGLALAVIGVVVTIVAVLRPRPS